MTQAWKSLTMEECGAAYFQDVISTVANLAADVRGIPVADRPKISCDEMKAAYQLEVSTKQSGFCNVGVMLGWIISSTCLLVFGFGLSYVMIASYMYVCLQGQLLAVCE
jgi:hypothetical protein